MHYSLVAAAGGHVSPLRAICVEPLDRLPIRSHQRPPFKHLQAA